MASIKIYLNTSTPSKDGAFPLVLQVILNRNKKVVRTTYKLHKEDFDTVSGKAKYTTSTPYPYTEEQLNKGLASKVELMNDILIYLTEYQPQFELADAIHLYRNSTKGHLVSVSTVKMINELRLNDQESTADAYQSTLRKLLIYTGNSTLTFDDINNDWLDTYHHHLSHEKLKGNSVNFYLRILRAIYNHAQKNGLVGSVFSPFRHRRFNTIPSKTITLEPLQLSKIINADLSKEPVLSQTRDLFLFSYYSCGMSFMDVACLKKTDVQGDMLCYFHNRSKKETNVKIVSHLRMLIDKYIDLSDTDYILPVFLSNEENTYAMYRKKLRIHNSQLKNLAEHLNLPEGLNSRVAKMTSNERSTSGEITLTIKTAEGNKGTIKISYTSEDEIQDSIMKALENFNNKRKDDDNKEGKE